MNTDDIAEHHVDHYGDLDPETHKVDLLSPLIEAIWNVTDEDPWVYYDILEDLLQYLQNHLVGVYTTELDRTGETNIPETLVWLITGNQEKTAGKQFSQARLDLFNSDKATPIQKVIWL